MKTRYVVIDDSARVRFEKETHLKYGYQHAMIFDKVEEALKFLDAIGTEAIKYCIEKVYSDGKIEVIYTSNIPMHEKLNKGSISFQ